MRHAFHIVDISPWPLTGSVGAILIAFGFVFANHNYRALMLFVGLIIVLSTIVVWWRDVIREATLQGIHSSFVKKGIQIGFILFITSEVCFFFSFFWAYFHRRLAPSPEIGGVWPPVGIIPPNPFHIPLLNTGILLASGVTLTWSHIALINGNRKDAIFRLVLTCILGAYFLSLQGVEYIEIPFTIADSVYGRCFYLLTGFHGLHVLIGALFLMVCLGRIYYNQFRVNHHVGYESAIWYWHFVDVVWLFLFCCIYWWPSSLNSILIIFGFGPKEGVFLKLNALIIFN